MQFQLSDNFVDKYKRKKAPFGFNGLGELVYMRTYSRIKQDGKNERWWETVRRVVEGTYSMQKQWIDSHQLGWNPWQAQKSAQEMYDRIFNMKFLPPGRGLWAMGTPITEEKGLYAALNNCAFVSTKTLKEDYSKPFCFLMDASMLGVGVGFDTKGAGEIVIKGVNKDRAEETFEIPDTREGWVESLKLLLESYFHGTAPITFSTAGSEKIRIESGGSLLINTTSAVSNTKFVVAGNTNQFNPDTGTGASIRSYVLSRSYTMSTSSTNLLTFDNWGTSAFEMTVFRRDNASPAGANVTKIYLAFHGSGTNITQASIAQESKVTRGSIHTTTFGISENNNTATLTVTGDDNGGETQDFTFHIMARGNNAGTIVVA